MAAARPAKGTRQVKLSRKAHIEQARKRLLGTWRSDKKRTMSEWVFPKRLAAKKYRFFKDIFGKNIWRFTKSRLYTDFEEAHHVCEYRIIWADDWSAVLILERDGIEKCHHIFFDGPFIYFAAGRAGNAEYFKKVST